MVGLWAVAGSLLVGFFAYAMSYRRCFLSILESVETVAPRGGFFVPLFLRAANRVYLPTPARRGCFAFVVRTLTRSEKHFTALGAFVGMGLLLCAQTLVTAMHDGSEKRSGIPVPALLSLPLILAYCTAVGIRFIFEIPADLRANWIFKVQVDPEGGESVALGRALMWTFLAPGLLFVCLPVYAYGWGWKVAVIHVGFLALMAGLLVETMIVRLRKIPFTCSLPLFKENAFVTVFLLFLGFYIFVKAGAFLEYVTMIEPVRVIVPTFLLGSWWLVIRQYRANLLEMDKRLIFEEVPVKAVQVLELD
jgi:hypothetical protein